MSRNIMNASFTPGAVAKSVGNLFTTKNTISHLMFIYETLKIFLKGECIDWPDKKKV